MKQIDNTILIATHNNGKYKELKKLLDGVGFCSVCLEDLNITHNVAETGKTFIENALLKARSYSLLSSLPTLADDGGLVINALNGEPGIYSSRYAGEHATDQEKVAHVLQKMSAIPEHEREAQFIGVVVFIDSNGTENIYQAAIEGIITQEPRGTLVKGLPYRQIFLLPKYGKTMAELDEENTAYESHRSKSLRMFLSSLS